MLQLYYNYTTLLLKLGLWFFIQYRGLKFINTYLYCSFPAIILKYTQGSVEIKFQTPTSFLQGIILKWLKKYFYQRFYSFLPTVSGSVRILRKYLPVLLFFFLACCFWKKDSRHLLAGCWKKYWKKPPTSYGKASVSALYPLRWCSPVH